MPTARRSSLAIAAIVCAGVAFFLSPLGGFLLALLAIVLGLLGFIRSAAPRVRGGLMSLAAILLGAVALVVKLVDGALRLIF